MVRFKQLAQGSLGSWYLTRQYVTWLILYALLRGVYSSRRIAKATRERVAFMSAVWLDPPDCGTGLDVRKRHLKGLAGRFA
jgi:hypothetical protein